MPSQDLTIMVRRLLRAVTGAARPRPPVDPHQPGEPAGPIDPHQPGEPGRPIDPHQPGEPGHRIGLG